MRAYIYNENIVFKFVKEVHSHIASKNSKIVLSEIASNLGICERILFNDIKFNAHVPPMTIINLMRFFGAKELLLFDKSIEEIMDIIKIESYSHFYDSFVKYFSLPPKKFYNLKKSDDSIYSNILLHRDSEFFSMYKTKVRQDLYSFYSNQVDSQFANFLNEDYIFEIWINTYLSDIVKKIKTTANML